MRLIIRCLARYIAVVVAFTVSVTGVAAQTSTARDSVGRDSVGRDSMTGPAAALRPGDVIRLRIWREPDLSGDFTVDASGMATLPRLGAIPVTNLSPEALRTQIVDGYQPFLTHSSIEVVLQRRIRVSGAVAKPGLYPADPTLTIGDVLALAGGATPQGKQDKVRLVRSGEKVLVNLDASTQIGSLPLHSGDELNVPERSWISRNPGVIVGGIGALVSVIYAITRFSR